MKMEILCFEELNYVVRYPENYEEGKKYPVLLHLHGSGSRAGGVEKLHTTPFFTLTAEYEDFPFVCVSPHCPSGNTWFDLFEQLKRFCQSLVKAPYADPERIYLMGTSMGGYGAWQLAQSLPELFAALVPMCGGGMAWNAGQLVNVPVWAFHGALDTIVSMEESKKMVDAVNKKGGSAKLTIYPERKHDAWTDTFQNKEVFSWLLEQKKEKCDVAEDTFKDSKLYG